jgi:integrase
VPTKSSDTVKQIISSLKSYQVDCGYDNSVFDNDTQVRRILQGVAIVKSVKNNLKPKLVRDPITHDLLKRMVQYCDDSFDRMTMRAAICVAFAGFLRVGDFIYTKWDTTSHLTAISWGHISFTKDTVTLLLPKSKTDATAKGTHIPMAATNDAICPRAALIKLFTTYPSPPNSPLFARCYAFSYNLGIMFTWNSFVDNIRIYLSKCSMDPSKYNSHSFRRGAAHSATAAGIPESEIQVLGRWASDSYKLYTGANDVHRLKVTRKVNRNLRSTAPRMGCKEREVFLCRSTGLQSSQDNQVELSQIDFLVMRRNLSLRAHKCTTT